MTKNLAPLSTALALLAVALIMSADAYAQASTSGSGASTQNSTWYATGGGAYMGFRVGRSDFGGRCGIGTFNCEDKGNAFSLFGGNMLNSHFGLEFGLTDFGRIDRAGGRTRAQGLNLSAIGRVPVGASFALFGKLGAIYGRTDVSSAAASGVVAGKESGFGPTYGGGASYDITPQLSAQLEWDQSNLRFAGSNREHINTTSIGLKYRF